MPVTSRAKLRGRTQGKAGLRRQLRVISTGLLRVNKAKITDHAQLDGMILLRTSNLTPDAADIARDDKALQDVERGSKTSSNSTYDPSTTASTTSTAPGLRRLLPRLTPAARARNLQIRAPASPTSRLATPRVTTNC